MCVGGQWGDTAHLPGVIASATTLRAIGVPVPCPHLDGLDSLLSIVQMPDGIPVVPMAIGGAASDALLAIPMLAMRDSTPRAGLADDQRQLREQVQQRNAAVHHLLGVNDHKTARIAP